MENTIVRREPSKKAVEEAKRSIDRAKIERLGDMGTKKMAKDRQVIEKIEEIFREKGKDEQTIAKEEKGKDEETIAKEEKGESR